MKRHRNWRQNIVPKYESLDTDSKCEQFGVKSEERKRNTINNGRKQEGSPELLFGCLVMSSSLWPHGLQHTRLPCPSLSPGTCSNSCPLSRWCHPTISSSVAPFSYRTWEWVRSADPQFLPQMYWIRNSDWDPAICVLTSPPGDSGTTKVLETLPWTVS